MRRKQDKRFWLCRHNHPMWRKPGSGHWVCHTCNDMNLSKAETGTCVHGHKRTIGKNCYTCNTYSQTLWLRDLDRDGKGECPNGHPVSHYDDSIVYQKTKKFRARRCRVCTEAATNKARSVPHDWAADELCRNKLHPKTEENFSLIHGKRQCGLCWEEAHERHLMRKGVAKEKKRGLSATWVDWVVVERLLSRGTTEYIRRGRHIGPTDGERWVAYCTFVRNHGDPETLYGEPGFEAMALWKMSQWKDLGRKHQWREFTLYDLMRIMPTKEYEKGGFLRKYRKREEPPA